MITAVTDGPSPDIPDLQLLADTVDIKDNMNEDQPTPFSDSIMIYQTQQIPLSSALTTANDIQETPTDSYSLLMKTFMSACSRSMSSALTSNACTLSKKIPLLVPAVNMDADSQETHTDSCFLKMETLCIIDPISPEVPSLTSALSDTFSKKTCYV